MALEDYARALTRREGAEAIPAPGDPGRRARAAPVRAGRELPRGAVLEDIEAFAREMAHRAGDGLGWS